MILALSLCAKYSALFCSGVSGNPVQLSLIIVSKAGAYPNGVQYRGQYYKTFYGPKCSSLR